MDITRSLQTSTALQLYIYFIVVVIVIPSCRTTTEQKPISDQDSSYHQEIAEHRSKFKQSFLKDPRSPLDSTDLMEVHFLPAQPEYRVECTVMQVEDATPFQMATYSGITKPYRLFAYTMCPLPDGDVTLEVYESLSLPNAPVYRDHLFLPFMDATNGEVTYGGGRYIDLKKSKIIGNKLIIDFNKTYNPWCAYSDGYNCPIPPKANHLEIAISAGESMYTGKKKQRPQ